MKTADYIGQTLDGKYKIERELGRGGMGTVYLATHVGTERHVAVKIIAAQFMERFEFIERFRREARAAGRLRHPNVVNVTDFGFAHANDGQVAYLVMEYLDGCTLGEILEEEHRLPLAWSLDIIEQICSAVHAAHAQGIIHRDLKPDNIWLEPNQRGGYTVKVLDFGIAKLEEHLTNDGAEEIHISYLPTNADAHRPTIADSFENQTVGDCRVETNLSEGATLAQDFEKESPASENETLVQPVKDAAQKGTLIQSSAGMTEDQTALFSINQTDSSNVSGGNNPISSENAVRTNSAELQKTEDLTRVGAVLGTPLFMSPEQCRGEKLTAQSDIYSLGVISYRMLSGKLPFEGDHTQVMRAHKEAAPPPIESKKVPRKVKKVIFTALAKTLPERPLTAEIFAAEMRSQSEGIGALLRRATVIYSEHLPKFLSLAILFYTPIALFAVLQVALSFAGLSDTVSEFTKEAVSAFFAVISAFFGIFCGYALFGTTTWLVSQILAVPLRPVKLRPALEATRRKWKTFAGTGTMTTTLTLLGLAMCVVPGLIMWVGSGLVAPIVMMENRRGFDALKRSSRLIRRSLGTAIATVFIMFFVPLMLSGTIAYLARSVAGSINFDSPKTAIINQKLPETSQIKGAENTEGIIKIQNNEGYDVNIGNGDVKIKENNADKTGSRLTKAIQEALTQILLLPITILVGSFSSIVMSLLYLKTRQVGGEPMQELLAQFEEAEQPRTKWQESVRRRLLESGRTTGRG